MQTKTVQKRGHSRLGWTLPLLAATACLWPAAAAAQPPDPTESDIYGNTAAGSAALLRVTSGYNNSAIGLAALREDNTGHDNTAGGTYALSNTTGSFNTGTGSQALYQNTAGADNSAFGANALYWNTTGGLNTSVGVNALFSNSDGGNNTASGIDALFSNVHGSYNTASGGYALYANTGSQNTAFGYQVLRYNTTGVNNTATGLNALYNNTSGQQSTAVGVDALFASTIGSNNVAVGFGALKALAGASSGNIALGINAGSLTKAGSNNIYIGHWGAANESGAIRIGRAQSKAFIAGITGVPLSGATVVVNSNGQLGVVASSKRYKKDIAPLVGTSEKLAQLRPVSYRYKAEPDATHYGLIAEEVDQVMPELVVRDGQNRPESVQYQELIPLLLQQQQELKAELARQRALIEQQSAQIEQQGAALAALRRTLDPRLAGSTRVTDGRPSISGERTQLLR